MFILTWKFCAVNLNCGIFVKLLQPYFVWNINIPNQYDFSIVMCQTNTKILTLGELGSKSVYQSEKNSPPQIFQKSEIATKQLKIWKLKKSRWWGNLVISKAGSCYQLLEEVEEHKPWIQGFQ